MGLGSELAPVVLDRTEHRGQVNGLRLPDLDARRQLPQRPRTRLEHLLVVDVVALGPLLGQARTRIRGDGLKGPLTVGLHRHRDQAVEDPGVDAVDKAGVSLELPHAVLVAQQHDRRVTVVDVEAVQVPPTLHAADELVALVVDGPGVGGLDAVDPDDHVVGALGHGPPDLDRRERLPRADGVGLGVELLGHFPGDDGLAVVVSGDQEVAGADGEGVAGGVLEGDVEAVVPPDTSGPDGSGTVGGLSDQDPVGDEALDEGVDDERAGVSQGASLEGLPGLAQVGAHLRQGCVAVGVAAQAVHAGPRGVHPGG